MSDLLFLLGAAACAISVAAAIISVFRLNPPRVAAILLCAGIAMMAVAAWMAPGTVGIDQLDEAWARLSG